MENYSVL